MKIFVALSELEGPELERAGMRPRGGGADKIFERRRMHHDKGRVKGNPAAS